MIARRFPAVVAAALIAALQAVALAQPPPVVTSARVARLEQWLQLIYRHEPGIPDDPATDVASWTGTDLHTLLTDARVLTALMRNPRLSRFSEQRADRPRPEVIRYTTSELARLRLVANILSCRAVPGASRCADLHEVARDEEGLGRILAGVESEPEADADNGVLRRGALLHADILMLVPGSMFPVGGALTDSDPAQIRFSDGRQVGLTPTAVHWSLARMLLDAVKPAGSERPAPERDDMVRHWYRATAAWLQLNSQHEPDHLDRGRRLFPEDPELLFLTGAMHETFAGPGIQTFVRGLVLPLGVTVTVRSEHAELRQAEDYLRRALKIDPKQTEARLRLGHVLLMLDRSADAAVELRQLSASVLEPQMEYYASMFLGAAEEALGRYAEAGTAYSRAAALYPTSQSPHIALSALARRRGDRSGAWRAIQEVFALPGQEPFRDDPWWSYPTAQGRNAGDLLDELRRPFRRQAAR